jgi:hypothetical protein
MRAVLGLVLLALPVRALAQMPLAEASSSREAQLRPLLDVAHVTPGLSLTLLAQAVAEVERVDQESHGQTEWAAGAELAWRGDECHIVAAGGVARAIKENLTQNASAEQWSRVCAGGGLPVPQLELAERYEFQVRPSLYSPRSVLARPYSRLAVDGLLTFIDIPPGDPLSVRLQMGLFGFGYENVGQHSAGMGAGYSMFGAEAIAVRLWAPRQGPIARTDATVDILAMGGWFAEPDNPVAIQSLVVALTPVRVRALRLGSPHLLLDGEVALVGGGFTPPEAPPDVPRLTVPPADITTVTGSLTIYGGDEWHVAGAGYARTLRPTTDGFLLLEDRGTAWLTLRTNADQQILDLTLQGFGAHTTVQGAYGATDANTYGGGLGLGWLLARSMRLGFDAEVARSFYARLDAADPQPLPELGFRVLWSFSTLFGSRS